MTVTEYLIERVNEKGWMSLSSLYFDNALVVNIFNSRGYIAYSPSKDMFYFTGAEDTSNTDCIERKYVALDNKYVGQSQMITVVGGEHLQHFDIHLFSHYRFINDDQEVYPTPVVPTPDEIKALVVDPETGLVDGEDVITQMNGEQISCRSLYPDNKITDYSGLKIVNYQKFIKNHEKFIAALNTMLGVSDAI